MSSPEQLDRLPAVSNTRAWLALVAIAALLAVIIGWGFGGTIPVTVVGQGIFIDSREAPNELQALIYMPVGDAVKVSLGQQVQVLPNGINKEEYGYIRGQVARISGHSLNMNEIVKKSGSNVWGNNLKISEPVLEIQVKLKSNPKNISGFNWSASAGPPIKIGSRTPCSGWIIVNNIRPIDLLLQRK